MVRYQKFSHLSWVYIDIANDKRFGTVRAGWLHYYNMGYKVEIWNPETKRYAR